MSYEILYRRLFIKVPAAAARDCAARPEPVELESTVAAPEYLYLPMIETGSSNCYEWNNVRRSRSWQRAAFLDDRPMFLSAAQILKTVDNWNQQNIEKYAERGKSYDPRSFSYYDALTVYGYGKCTTSFTTVRNFYRTGIEQALTVEEADGAGLSMSVRRHWDEEVNALIPEKMPVMIERGQDLVENFKQWRTDLGEYAEMIRFSFGNDYAVDRLIKAAKPERKRAA